MPSSRAAAEFAAANGELTLKCDGTGEGAMKARSVVSSIGLLFLLLGPSHFIAAEADQVDVPRFLVDPYWPKPLPNRWVTGEVGGICIDRQNNVVTLNRANLTNIQKTLGKVAAPPVIIYDVKGDVVSSWGDPKALPKPLHNCVVDHE